MGNGLLEDAAMTDERHGRKLFADRRLVSDVSCEVVVF